MNKEQEKQEEGTWGWFRRKENFLKLIVAVGLAGMVLIFVSSWLKPQEDSGSVDSTVSESDGWENLEEYRANLTCELGNMIASIEGAGRTKLMLTIDGTVRSLYACDSDVQTNERSGGEQQNNEKKSYLVVRRKDGSEQAVTIGQLMPNVRGVLVVCEGGNDEAVASSIKEAVAAAVHLSPTHICVRPLSVYEEEQR